MNTICKSQRARTVARWFGVSEIPPDEPALSIPQLELLPGTITLLTGASGAGKSSLLRSLRHRERERLFLDLDQIPLGDTRVVDCFTGPDDALEDVLLTLGRVGLGEVWTYLRTPAQLSHGQRWRLRLALALWQLRLYPSSFDQAAPCPILIADEFCGMLDRISAWTVSRCLRRTIDPMSNVAVLLASAREDLIAPLRPDAIVHCDFGTLQVHHPGMARDFGELSSSLSLRAEGSRVATCPCL